MHCQRDAGAGDAESGHQRQQLNAKVLHRHDHEQQRDHDPCDAHDQTADRRFHLEVHERALEPARDLAADEVADRKNDQGGQQLRAELQCEVNDVLGICSMVSTGAAAMGVARR